MSPGMIGRFAFGAQRLSCFLRLACLPNPRSKIRHSRASKQCSGLDIFVEERV